MKSAVVASTLLFAVASARSFGHHGHGHLHAKRLVTETEWVTEVETVTVFVDDASSTEAVTTDSNVATIATSLIPAQFLESSQTQSASAPPPTTAAAPSTTSAPAPQPTTSSAAPPPPPPPPSTSTVAATTQAPAPSAPAAPAAEAAQTAQAQSSGGGGGGGGSHNSGDMTFYTIGLGACGTDQSGQDDSVSIVALSHLLMGEQSNGNPYCGKSITISYGGKTAQATVMDKCMGCATDSIDVSAKVFNSLAEPSAGRVEVEWWFN